MGLFKKKQLTTLTEIKCPAEGCSFTCTELRMLERHVGWKRPELKQKVESI